MNRLMVALLLVSTSLFAAPGGKPNKQPPAQGPLVMVDSNSGQLGPAITGDPISTFIRYNGETFEVQFRFVGTGATDTRRFLPVSGALLYTLPNCTGPAYINLSAASAFTPRATVVVHGAYLAGMPSALNMYATAPHPTPTSESPADYVSQFRYGVCDNVGGSAYLVEASFVVDLIAQFPPPYELQ